MSEYKPTCIETLTRWSNYAYDNEEKFLSIFGKGDPWFLNYAAWNEERMHFSYVCKSGQHVGDSVELQKWYDFIMTIYGNG